jgi:hypothetical protein
MWRIRWCRLFFYLLALAPAGAARAEVTASRPCEAVDDVAKARAQEHVDRGNDLMDARAFGDALIEFRTAYAIFASPKILFNEAQVESELGHFIAAAAHYDDFVRTACEAETPDVAQRIAIARASARTARTRIATIQPAAPDGIEVMVDAHSYGKTPLAAVVPVDPGPHRVSFRRAGLMDSNRDVSLSAGERLRVVADVGSPEPHVDLITVPGERPPPAPRSLLHRWPFWAATGAVAVVGALVAVYAVRRLERPPCPALTTCTSGGD